KRPAHFAPLILADEAARQDKLRAERLSRLDTDIRQLKAQAVSAVVATIATGLANIVVPPPDLMQPIAKSGAGLTAATRQRAAGDEKELSPVAYGVTEGSVSNARIQKRGEPDKPGPEVPRRFLEILGGDMLPSGAGGSGRLELAQWITRPSNPLTA